MTVTLGLTGAVNTTRILAIGAFAGGVMMTIQAAEFKAKCLALMDQVARTGETILITKNGKPVAELHAHQPPRAKSPFGLHRGRSEILGDIIEPMDTGLWNALK